MDFIKVLFGKETPNKNKQSNTTKLKVVVTEFVEYGNHNYGSFLTHLLRENSSFEVYYFTETFDKKFLNLQGRHFFDLSDTGNKILQKLDADVVVWGYQEDKNIRLNFQTANAYTDLDNISYSLLDSLYIPIKYFEPGNVSLDIFYYLVVGAIVASISEQRVNLKQLKKKMLRKVLSYFNECNLLQNDDIIYSPYILNIVSLIYMSYEQKKITKDSFETNLELYKNAFLQKKQITQNVHLGCMYKNIGQLYEMAINQDIEAEQQWNMYNKAINNYKTAQKYIDQYNYPYDFALISFKLAQLNFRYWKFANNKYADGMQGLRNAVTYLRIAEKTYTEITFPELWSKIEGYLGYYLSLLGLFSKSNDISRLAIQCYRNKQSIYEKELHPIIWAKIQENIANVYYNMGKIAKDKSSYREAIEHYESALKIYETNNMQREITIVSNSIEKVSKALKRKK